MTAARTVSWSISAEFVHASLFSRAMIFSMAVSSRSFIGTSIIAFSPSSSRAATMRWWP
jgi:hypothetical protein